MFAVLKKEIKTFFASPIGFIFVGFFLLISGFVFAISNLLSRSPHYGQMLSFISSVFILLVPMLTMRLFSEEMKQRTDVLLITSPLRLSGIVIGKYLAAVVIFVFTTLITCLYPIMMRIFGGVIATWEIVGGYIGFILMGATFISVGLLISAMTENVFIAAVVTLAALLLIMVIDWIMMGLPKDITAGIVFSLIIVAGIVLFIYFTLKNLYVTIATGVVGLGVIALVYLIDKNRFDGFVVRFFEWFSLLKRFEEFNLGTLKLSPIVYYISFSAVFVFLTIRVIEKRRWS